jgi:hypothetical protein
MSPASMSRITITYSPERSSLGGHVIREPDGTNWYPFSPCFEARQGTDLLLAASVRLGLYAAELAESQLKTLPPGGAGPAAALRQLLIRYGARRMEAAVRELHASGSRPDGNTDFWRLGEGDLDELLLLLPLTDNKSCDYQQPFGRDLMCTATSPSDQTAAQSWNGRLIAPTSRAICRQCELPESDVLCSNLLHPTLKGDLRGSGVMMRQILSVMCDLGRGEAISDVSQCQAGGHACWQRHVAAEPAVSEPVSPLGVPEQLDVLDAYWRLSFGKRLRLLDLTTAAGTASLSLPCGSRAEFESRLSALADTIDKLKVDEALLPPMADEEKKDKIKGSLDALDIALRHKLPACDHARIDAAIRSLRKVRQARNAIQHGIAAEGGLTGRLRQIGIHDAPPNWEGAWNSIRAQTADALSAIRNELRSALDDA